MLGGFLKFRLLQSYFSHSLHMRKSNISVYFTTLFNTQYNTLVNSWLWCGCMEETVYCYFCTSKYLNDKSTKKQWHDMQLWYRMKQLSNTRPSVILVSGKYQTWKFIASISSIIPMSQMIVHLLTHINILLIKDENYWS